jgi:hypothetical protein
MVARVITFSGADPARQEERMQRVREGVLPTLQRHDGYAGYLNLYDADAARMRALILWESREAAEAAEEELAPMRERMIQGFGMTIQSNEIVEVPIVDIGTPART